MKKTILYILLSICFKSDFIHCSSQKRMSTKYVVNTDPKITIIKENKYIYLENTTNKSYEIDIPLLHNNAMILNEALYITTRMSENEILDRLQGAFQGKNIDVIHEQTTYK